MVTTAQPVVSARPFRIVCLRGIGEPLSGNMISHLTKLIGGPVEVVELPWEAEYGFVPRPLGAAFAEASGNAVPLLRKYLDGSPVPVFVICYSGGCYAGGLIAAHGHPNLLGIALIADPFQPVDIAPGGRFGIAGSRPIRSGVPARWLYNLDDGICCCPRDTPLRTLADQTSSMSLRDLGAWLRDLADRARTGRWQKVVIPWADPIATFRMYSQAARLALAYAGLGQASPHTRYAVQTAQLRDLAAWIVRTANQ
jgi:hypothetical protein